MSFKVISIAALMVAGLTANAAAADIPARMPVKATPNQVVAYNWGGFYTASTIGYSRQETEGTFVLAPTQNFNTSKSRLVTGSHVGLQHQWGNWVLGVEGGYTNRFSSTFDTAAVGAGCFNIGLPAGVSCNTTIRDVWTFGGKAGYAFGNWMIYGTGGYASGRIDTFGIVAGQAFSASSERHDGWYAGAGIDVYVTRFMWSDLILGVEYRHIDLSSERHVDVTGPAANKNMSATADMILAKATFKWVGAGPLSMFK